MKLIRVSSVIALVSLALLTSCGGDRPLITVSISPTTATMDQGATQQLTATVTGSTNSAVLWSIREGSVGGNISGQGLYTAPAAAGTAIVTAISVADPTKSAAAQISIRAVAISVSPSVGELAPGAAHPFAATVTGSVNRNVIWSVQEGEGGGSVTADGVYTAPATVGTFHIIATSVADATKKVTVAITVANLAVSISPRAVGVLPGATRAFTASVAGSMDDRVSWAVQEGAAGGVITNEGAYTASTTPGEYHVIATSVAHPSVFAVATVFVSNSGFSAAGNMTQARSNHTATLLLPSGDVLLAGGGTVDLVAEIFDHATGSFRATGTMQADRYCHTATRLQNGMVLLVGGGSSDLMWNDISLSSAELYDPATGKFTPTGAMGYARAQHTATLLNDGKVLIAGGADWWEMGTTETAELYDPATGTFTPTGSMQQARDGHTATRLLDGRVLIAGGGKDALAEIYDPAAGVFVAAGPFPRRSHTATLLTDGRVLLAGGECGFDPVPGPVYCEDAQIFNPSTGEFSVAAKLDSYRSLHTETRLPNGQVLLAGGWIERSAESTAGLFDPALSTFILTGSMAKPRVGHTATLLLDGRVLVAGGSDDRSAEFYTQRP